MKSIKDILAELTGLKARVDAAGQAEVARLEGIVTGMVAQLENDLTTARASIASLTASQTDLQSQVQDLTGKLSDANRIQLDATTVLRAHLAALPAHAEYKDGGTKAGAALAELITAEINATNNAIAATGLKLNDLPAGGEAPEALTRPKNLTEACIAAKKKTA